MPRHLLLAFALLAVCLCLAPARYRPSDPNASLAAAESITFQGTGSPRTTDLAELARTDVVATVRACLERYQREVKGYTCILAKHERVDGKLREPEIIRCVFREQPFSVVMHWLEGAGAAEMTLFVRGEHDGKILVRPAGLLAQKALKLGGKHYVERATDDPQVRSSSRYSMHEFGIARGMERTYRAWNAAQERGTLKAEYLGLQTVPEVGNRPCHILRRHCDPPEEEGLTSVTIAIDAETWLQVSSVLKAGDELIGSYHFRDVHLNPVIAADQFSADVLKP
jgi:hypothetical protein